MLMFVVCEGGSAVCGEGYSVSERVVDWPACAPVGGKRQLLSENAAKW